MGRDFCGKVAMILSDESYLQDERKGLLEQALFYLTTIQRVQQRHSTLSDEDRAFLQNDMPALELAYGGYVQSKEFAAQLNESIGALKTGHYSRKQVDFFSNLACAYHAMQR